MDKPSDREIDLASKLSRLMLEHGVQPHNQTALLSQLCGLSTSQARRKLQGAVWSFFEVLTLARHFGISLDALLAGDARISCAENLHMHEEARLDASLHVGKSVLPCTIVLGPKFSTKVFNGAFFVAVQLGEAWHVSEANQIADFPQQGNTFQVLELVVRSPSAIPVRLAFLDDDPTALEMLTTWFDEVGYQTEGFSTAEQLLAQQLESYDAFVIDFLLAGGHSAKEAINTIRAHFPQKPIALLTGQLQDGTVSESDLVPMLRAMNVLFFEKPVRPSVLAASLQNAIDQTVR